MINFFLWLYCL